MNIVRQYLKESWIIAIGYMIILEAAMVAAILYWPKFSGNIPSIAKLVPFASLSRLVENISIGGYWPYFTIQHFFKGGAMFGMAASALFSSILIARDADQRTAEFLLSKPISRKRILGIRFTTASVLLCAPIFISSISAIFISKYIGENLQLSALMMASAYISIVLISVLSLGCWVSSISTHQMKPVFVVVGFVLFQFAFYLVDVLNKYTVFKLIDTERLSPIAKGEYPWVESLCCIFFIIILYMFSLRNFTRRDF